MDDDFPKTVVCSLSRAGHHLMSTTKNQDIIALVSIGDPGQKKPTGFHQFKGSKIRLEFDDVEEPAEEPTGEDSRGYWQSPSLEDIERLVRFGSTLRGRTGTALVHCFAGISRSSAAGYILNNIFFGPGREDDAMRRTLRGCLEKGVHPNSLMVKYGDQILGRDGKMVYTYDEFFGAPPRAMY